MWATSKVNRHALGGRIGSQWTAINIELRKLELICWHFASKTRSKGGRLQNAVQTFSDSCSPVFVVFVVFAPSYRPFPHMFCWLSLDDLGWSDVRFHGSQINSPNMDKSAFEGVILDSYYVQPICSPTRGALLTGMYPIHTGKNALWNYLAFILALLKLNSLS